MPAACGENSTSTLPAARSQSCSHTAPKRRQRERNTTRTRLCRALTTPSWPPETTQRPSGEKATRDTPRAWPRYVCTQPRRRTSQIFKHVSSEPEAKNSPVARRSASATTNAQVCAARGEDAQRGGTRSAPYGWKSTDTHAARWPVSVRVTAASNERTQAENGQRLRLAHGVLHGTSRPQRTFGGRDVPHFQGAARSACHHRLLRRVKRDALNAALVPRQALSPCAGASAARRALP